MRKVTVKELYRNWESLLGQEVEFSGWVKKLRDQKSFGFIELNDGSFFNGVQVVFNSEMENFEEIARLSIISTIRVVGKVVVSEGSGQKFEVVAEIVEVIQKADLDYPLQNKRHTFEYLRTMAHLRPRTNTFNAVFRVRSVLAYAIHKF
ncbi:MAG: OB-fold nucleic acid binding domain-containing protein, partial [Fusobacteriaceae bacterium]